MRKSIFFLMAFVAAMACCLGGCKSYKNSIKEGNTQDSIAGIIAREVVPQQAFLLKGERLTIKRFSFNYVNNSTNYIEVNGNKGVVQVSPAFSGGPNGVGGFTVEGTVTQFSSKELKNGDMRVSFHLSAPIGSCEVAITIYKESAKAVANINSTFYSGRATLYGNVIPIDNSVFQGRYPF